MSRNPRDEILAETLGLMDLVNANLDRLSQYGVDCLNVRDESGRQIGMICENARVSLLLKFRIAE